MAAGIALLTGSRGFTGHYVARALKDAGYEVRELRLADKPVDLLDREALRAVVGEVAPDVVVHLAAISFVAHDDVDAIYRTNIVGTRNLLQALASGNASPRHVVLASSANIYGNAGGSIPESTPPAPQNDYAVSKLAMEHMARTWQAHLPISIVRPFNYTGVGQSERFLIPKIVSHFRARERVIELGNIDVWRDFSDVRDIARAYVRLVEDAPGAEAINFCSGREISLRDVLAMMQELAGYPIEVRVRQDLVRANEVVRLRGDTTRMDAVLGEWERLPFEATLRWMYEAAPSIGSAPSSAG
jgi:nucleoside-diphosphate-sugar epimerase